MSTFRQKTKREQVRTILGAAAAMTVATLGTARAGTDTVPVGNSTSLRSGQTVPTVSLSGSTAIRNFTISPGFTLLDTSPGNSITLGPVGSEITYTLGGSASLQFAQKNFNTADATSGVIQSHSALRVEWHEQGAVEGMLELADGQINDQIYGNLIYNPTTGNATYVNQNKFGGTGSAVFPPATLGGHTLNNNANDSTRDAQAQNRVQMSISDTVATQGFAKGGIPSNNSGAFNKSPTDAGYGKGNPALAVGALGTPGARFQLQDESVLNMTAGAANPDGGTYGSGAWNTAGAGNLVSKRLGITATLMIANPGTGLTHINRGDAQWLQTTGRLRNGADFNMTTRDAGSGTRNVAATNTGVDASWAVGENDAGNGNALSGGTDQIVVGPSLTFSNKTAGGGQLRRVVQRSRMAIGTLSMGDGITSFKNGTSTPLRALDYRDDADDLSNNSNGGSFKNWNEDGSGQPVFTTGDLTAGTFIRASAATITNGAYGIYQNEQFVTVRRPDADYATDKVKGDNTGHDVQDVRDNILNSVLTFGAGTSVATPADAMIDNSLIFPQLMLVNKPQDGLNQSDVNATRNVSLRNTFLADSRAANFNPADPATIKQGSSAFYGQNVAQMTLNPDGTTTNRAPNGGSIALTANNYFFGDFKRDNASATGNREVRDYSDIGVAQKAQAALAAGGTTGWDDAGDLNSRVVGDVGGYTFVADMAFTPTKGDLIALGDFNSDGAFDGKDLYMMARGTALADSTGTTTLSGGSDGFADKVRSGVLRKNAALDSLDAATSTAAYTGNTPTNSEAKQRVSASANAINDPQGTNAFNKRDVNRDGLVDFVDAITSDKFVGKNYTNLDDQLAATGAVRVGQTVTPISLVDVELNDNGAIDQTDVDVVNTALTGAGKESWIGTLKKTGGGNVGINYSSGTFTVAAGSKLQVNAGAVSVGGAADPLNGGANRVDVENNSAFNVTAGLKHVGTLSGTGTTTVSPAATLASAHVGGTKTVVNGKLITKDAVGSFDGTIYSGVTGMVASGRGGGAWAGNGIVTSLTEATTSILTSLAVASADELGKVGQTFGGETLASGDTVVMYTYGGDADMNGILNGDDYFQIDAAVNTPGASGWHNGDFDYNGAINGDDYFILDSNINGQTLGVFSTSAGVVTSMSGVSAVPEPGSAGLALTALGYSLARASRRRRRWPV